MRISDWSSDVCSSDLSERAVRRRRFLRNAAVGGLVASGCVAVMFGWQAQQARREAEQRRNQAQGLVDFMLGDLAERSEERRVGKEGVSTGRSRGSPSPETKKTQSYQVI